VGVSIIIRGSGERVFVGRVMEGRGVGEAAGFAITTKAKGRAWVGVTILFKLSAGDVVAVHAATPTTAQIKAAINKA
jgi:hypothetical protein